ncbi:MAG: SDR family NAD(P)-dependent oxidoreductase [Acidimicrobiales bacterium]
MAVVTGGGTSAGCSPRARRRRCQVALVGRTAATLAATAELQHSGATVTTAVADVTDHRVHAAIAAINEQFGPIDLLVNRRWPAWAASPRSISTWWHAFRSTSATMAWCQDIAADDRSAAAAHPTSPAPRQLDRAGGSAYIASRPGSPPSQVLDAELRPKGVLTFAIARTCAAT